MNSTTLIVIFLALAAVALIVGVALVSQRRARQRHSELMRHFGPEYDIAVDELGTAARADRVLSQREHRVQRFQLRQLNQNEQQRFATEWQQIQARFVDDPGVAVSSANDLINRVMQARGYPTESFDQRLTDLSVDYPQVVQHYRAAHYLAGSVHNGAVDTEELRQAVIHFRALFSALLQPPTQPVAWQQHAHAH